MYRGRPWGRAPGVYHVAVATDLARHMYTELETDQAWPAKQIITFHLFLMENIRLASEAGEEDDMYSGYDYNSIATV